MKEISLSDLAGSSQATSADLTTSTPADENLAVTPDSQIARLSEADQARVVQLAESLDLTRSGIESSYGKDVQRATSTFADDILSRTRSKDAGQAGELLQGLLTTVDEAELSGVKKVPILGTIAVNIAKLRRRYEKVSSQIDDIVSQLERAQSQLTSDISMFNTMYDRNAEQYRDLKITVLAGKKALDDFNTNQLPKLEEQAKASQDPMQAQILSDFKAKLERFAKRLDDLDRVSVICLQTAPQIKIIQNADQMVCDKIDTTISTTIPVWKSQMVIALGLENQRQALELQKKTDDLTNRLIQSNARALHQGAVEAEKANQRSVVDIETLEKVNSELIATLRETVQIQREGKANREAAEVKMRQLEGDLKTALIENAQSLGR